MNSKVLYPRQTLVFRVSFEPPKHKFYFNILFLTRSLRSNLKHCENPNRIFRVSFETASIFDSSDSSLFPIFPPPSSPAGHPLKNLYRITFGSRSLLFGRTRTFARRPDNSCLPLHTIDVPFRRASDLFCLFFLFLFLFLPLSSHDSPHT